MGLLWAGALLALDWTLFWYFFFFRYRTAHSQGPVNESERFHRTTRLLFAGIGAWMFMAWAHASAAPLGEQASGAAVLLIGQGLMLSARAALGFLGNRDLLFALSPRQVNGGPYRFLRHPMYAGLFLALLGSSFAAGSLPAAVTAILLICPLLYMRMRAER